MRRGALAIILGWLFLLQSATCRGEGLEALVGADGRVRVARARLSICEIGAGLYNAAWAGAEADANGSTPGAAPTHNIRIAVPGGGIVNGAATIIAADGKLSAEYVFTPAQDVALNSLHVSAQFSIPALARGRWTADGQSGTFPAEFGDIHLFNAPIRFLKLDLPSSETLEFSFPDPTPVLLQDNRKWGPSFVVRIHRSSSRDQPFKKGAPVKIGFTLAAPGGVNVEHDAPCTIVAGRDWIPLNLALDIEAGSALDFSAQGFQDPPAGKHGWVTASPDGHFVFEKDRRRLPRRFYGVNFCFSAQYLPHEQAERISERLARLGYNAVRLHHYEGDLIGGQADSVTLNPARLDEFDYLMSALFKRGLYVTTDLFVFRPVPRSDIGLPGDGNTGIDEFKDLVPVHAQAFENWKAFARNLLTHVNPYTQRRAAWNRWLAARYGNREVLAAAWGPELKQEEDAVQGSVAMATSLEGDGPRARDCIAFLAHMERDFYQRAAKFLKKELGVKALLTNMSSWINHATDQEARSAFDFVDDHFYVDHPQFLDQPWRLPSRCPNASPVAGGASGGRRCAFTRLLGKPFTITEYNYSAPGRFRGVGGILTGALGALQGWDGVWRFAYSHNRDNLLAPGAMNYFDMAADPLSQAAERASLCLFLRNDIRPAPAQFVVALDPEKIGRQAWIPGIAPGWDWMAWIARVATLCRKDTGTAPRSLLFSPQSNGAYVFLKKAEVIPGVDPYTVDAATLLGRLPRSNPSDPAKNVFHSATGEVIIDAPEDILVLDTERTAGGYAPAGKRIVTKHGVEIAVRESDATVWVSALDGKPIVDSRRLLLTHLTDLQNTDIRYAERGRQTLLAWGTLPHLVRAGKAEVRVSLKKPDAYKAWALSTDGKRVAEVAIRAESGSLMLTADVAGFKDHGAIMCYEIARE